jgi:hypothetical protein
MEMKTGADYELAINQRMTSEQTQALGCEIRRELHRCTTALRSSLQLIFDHVERVEGQRMELANNNKLLRRRIRDLENASYDSSNFTAVSRSRFLRD